MHTPAPTPGSRVPGPRSRRGISLVEVLVAAAVMAVLSFGIHDTMVGTLKGVEVDRVTEARRQLTLDLLERFAQPYSDVEYLFQGSPTTPAVRELTIDEALRMVAVPAADRALVKSILESGSVKGFSLIWHRGLSRGEGDARRLRKDRLWIHTVFTKAQRGPQVGSFRVFTVREA